MTDSLNRRDFLKLTSMLPLLAGTWPAARHAQPLTAFKQAGTVQADAAPNIMILVFDTLSARHISLYGYPRETMPNLARFAESASVYHNHYSAGSFTSPGTASLLTGTYPWTHRAFNLRGLVPDELVEHNIFHQFARRGYTRLAYSHNLLAASLLYQFRHDLEVFLWPRTLYRADIQLADRLFRNDYIAGFWSERFQIWGDDTPSPSLFLSFLRRLARKVTNLQLERELGSQFPRGIPNLPNSFFVLEDAIEWLIKRLPGLPNPYLLYFHLLPPHEPYTTRREFVDRFKTHELHITPKPDSFFSRGEPHESLQRSWREYDEYIAYVDAEFGRLLDFMKQNGLLDDTCLIVTSDHGQLFERGIHGHVNEVLYQNLIRIPLLISSPGQSRRQDVYLPTSSVDVLPTALQIAGLPVPDWVEGRVLPPYSTKGELAQAPIFCVEAKSNPRLAALDTATLAVVQDGFKLIQYAGYGEGAPQLELYNLVNDPEERQDLSTTHPGLAGDLQGLLRDTLDEADRPYRRR